MCICVCVWGVESDDFPCLQSRPLACFSPPATPNNPLPPIPGSEASVDYYPAKRAKGIALIPGASLRLG